MARHGLTGRSDLYLCTPIRPDLLDFVARCIDGGVNVIQLREKRASDRDITIHAKQLAELCRGRGVPFFVNDRVDIALAVGADGVHIGQDDLSVETIRKIGGNDLLVGLSTHSPEELDAALLTDADYLSVGPIEETPTKPGRPGTGIQYLRYAAMKCDRPFFVTGGVNPSSIVMLADAGASRFVVVRHLTEASVPLRAAAELRDAIDSIRTS